MTYGWASGDGTDCSGCAAASSCYSKTVRSDKILNEAINQWQRQR